MTGSGCAFFLCPGIFLLPLECRGLLVKNNEKSDRMGNFRYKEQYAVVVICKDEEEQKEVYNRLKEEGHTLKVVAV